MKEHPQVYWSDFELDVRTVRVVQGLLVSQKALREREAKSEEPKSRIVIPLEAIRDALQALTGLDGLTHIDQSVRRVAIFDDTPTAVSIGITGIKEEVLKNLQKLEK